MASNRTRAPRPAVAGKDAAKPAAAAPAEQLGNQPAGSTQVDAAASTDTTGAAATAAASTDTAAPAAAGGAPVSPAPAVVTGTGPLADSLDELEGDEVEGLWVVAIPEHGFRRLGYRFTREGFGIAMDALTAEQIEILENEPNLKVERGIFSGRVGERLE